MLTYLVNIMFVTHRFGCWKQQCVSFMLRRHDWRSTAETAEELCSQTMNKSAESKQWISNCFASLTVFTVYPKAIVLGIMPSHENAGNHFLNLLLVLLDTGTILGNKIPAGLKTLRTTKKNPKMYSLNDFLNTYTSLQYSQQKQRIIKSAAEF